MPKGYPGSKAPHGTLTRYTHHGCHCESCRDAMREHYGRRPLREYVAERRERAELKPHGTESRYAYGCHCDFCREAARVGRAGRRARERDAAQA